MAADPGGGHRFGGGEFDGHVRDSGRGGRPHPFPAGIAGRPCVGTVKDTRKSRTRTGTFGPAALFSRASPSRSGCAWEGEAPAEPPRSRLGRSLALPDRTPP